MKATRIHIYFSAVLLVLLLCCTSRKQMPSLEESYLQADKNPFGTYVAFREINEFFYRNDVRVKRTPVDKTLLDFNDTASLYICISKHFYLRGTERKALLEYVSRGNNAFISAADFDSSLLKSIGIAITDTGSYYTPSISEMKYTGAGLSAPYYSDSTMYQYYYNAVNSFFTIKPGKDNVRVLGTNENGLPNFIVIFHGKGRFFLHCEPRLFSNYFLLQKKNYKYLEQVFSVMSSVPDNVLWDDYYTKRNRVPSESGDDGNDTGSKHGLSVLLKYPSMAWAFWLALLLLAVYLLFGSKRRQRIIRPIPQAENTSVAFAKTIGRLYLQKKSNRNMADKMIAYLLEHIRNQYFISTTHLDEEFTAMLSRKSSVPYQQVQQLTVAINQVQQMEEVDDSVLLSLNKHIENFYQSK